MSGVRIERSTKILEIVIDRPPANAIDAQTSRDLGAAFVELRDDSALRVGIIRAAGEKFFSAGWDLKAAATKVRDDDWGPGGFAGLTELFDLRKPVIAAVNGLTVGGGLELALACDMIVAAERSEFFLPEVNVGIVADAGGAIRLPRRLPHAIAMEMLLTGRRLSSKEALQYGLVNYVVPAEGVLELARSLANRICEAAPLAVAACMEVLDVSQGRSVEEAFRAMRAEGREAYRRMRASADAKEGSRAFAEKRAPKWAGY